MPRSFGSAMALALLGSALPGAAWAQDATAPEASAETPPGTVESLGVYRATPPETQVLLTSPTDVEDDDEDALSEAERQRCLEEQRAASIRDEIIVCGEAYKSFDRYRTGSREETQARYARENNAQGEFGGPDGINGVAGPGIFHGPATASGCGLGCPPPMPVFVDVSALPAPPAGSDADRIARGLPPLGNDDGIEEADAEEAQDTAVQDSAP